MWQPGQARPRPAVCCSRVMKYSYEFLKLVVDSLSEHLVVIDAAGQILVCNKTWDEFGRDNGCRADFSWVGANYLKACDAAATQGDELGRRAAVGIRSVIQGERDFFSIEYPCHCPAAKRWFSMTVTPFNWREHGYCVISHQNITKRKLAELEVRRLSQTDGLTDVANRRQFDKFLETQWRRCGELGLPVSLALIDLDHFKQINDSHGHQVGDEWLVRIGRILKRFCRRKHDLVARFGGDEFAVVLAGSGEERAEKLLRQVLDAVIRPGKVTKSVPQLPPATVSIGLACMVPTAEARSRQLIRKADKRLYEAKARGRACLVTS